jgi:hypothetical protein
MIKCVNPHSFFSVWIKFNDFDSACDINHFMRTNINGTKVYLDDYSRLTNKTTLDVNNVN